MTETNKVGRSPSVNAFVEKYGIEEAKRAVTIWLAGSTDGITSEMAKDLDALFRADGGGMAPKEATTVAVLIGQTEE